jgi:hypothetical protein
MVAKKDEKPEEGEKKEESNTPGQQAPQGVSAEDFQKFKEEHDKYVSETNDFIKGSSVVVNTLASDPNLRAQFQEALKKQYGGVVGEGEQPSKQQPQGQPQAQTNSEPKAQDNVVTKRVDNIEIAQREDTISEFEGQMGITALKPEEQKEARRQIESYLNDFGWSVKDVPLPMLRKSLERAYVGTVGVSKLREEGKLEGVAAFRNNQAATMGSFPGGAPESQDQTPKLTAKQREWTEKLGVNTEEAEKAYLEQDKEQTRVVKSEKKDEGKN